MTIFFILWNFLFIIINNFQYIFNKLFFKYNKTNLFYKTKYNNLVFFELIFLSFFFNIKKFKDPYFKNIYYFRKKNNPNIFFFNTIKNKNIFNIKNNSIKLYTSSKYFNFLNFNNLNYILNKYYYNESIFFFYNNNNKNFKINYIFIYYINKTFGSKYNQLNIFNFNDFYKFFKNKSPIKINKLKKNNFNMIKFKKVNKFYILFFKNLFFSNQKINFIKNKIKNNFYSLFKINNYISNINKYLNINSVYKYNIMYLRKNKIFNKGRYSRNRQLYRTGVYWCLWLNIMLVYGLYFLFYRFSFNFGYIWWGILILFYSTIFSRILKYNFINIFSVFKEICNFIVWFGYIFSNVIFIFFKKLKTFILNFNFLKKIKMKTIFSNININYFTKIINYFYNYKNVIYFFNNNNKLNNYNFYINWFNFIFSTILKK